MKIHTDQTIVLTDTERRIVLSHFERQTIRYAVFTAIEDNEDSDLKVYSDDEIDVLQAFYNVIDENRTVTIETTPITRGVRKCL
jgi:hypothetical protein